MRHTTRRQAVGAAVLLIVGGWLVLPLGAQDGQDEPDKTTSSLALPTKVFSKDGRIIVAEILEDTPDRLKLFDIKTGMTVTLPLDEVVTLKRGIGEAEAIRRTGLAPFLAWRVKQAQQVTPTGQIVTVTPTAVYVNLGERDGLETGDKLRVYREGEKLTDPETGEALGVLRSLMAELEVIEVQDKLSKARRTTNIESELQRGNTVELEWPQKAVAVLPISVPREEYSDLARAVREEWATTLVRRGVPVVERVQMEKVLTELGLQQTFLVDAETTSKFGKMVGAYAVLSGSIAPAGQRLKIHARLVKVRTGEALLAFSDELDPRDLRELGLAPQQAAPAPVTQPAPFRSAPLAPSGVPPLPRMAYGRPLTCVELDGRASYLKVAHSDSLDFTGPFTAETWIWIKRHVKAPAIIMSRASPAVGPWAMHLDSGVLWPQVAGGNWEPVPDDARFGPLPIEQWLHVAMVLKQQTVLAFVNGREVIRYAGPSRIVAKDNDLKIGGFPKGDRVLNAFMREVRVSSTARYTQDFVPQWRFEPDADTVLLLHCDEGRGLRVHDYSMYRNDAEMLGARWARR